MFCYKCGTQIPDNSKFCSNCGAQTSNPQSAPQRLVNSSNISAKRFDTNTIICLVVAVVMILSMLTLTMFTLKDEYHQYNSEISILSNDIRDTQMRKELNTFSRIAFVFMLAAIITTVIFRITKKLSHSFVSSIIGAGILIFYNMIICTWLPGYERIVIPGAGDVLCIGCSIVLVVLAFLALKKDNQIKTSPPQPMIFR